MVLKRIVFRALVISSSSVDTGTVIRPAPAPACASGLAKTGFARTPIAGPTYTAPHERGAPTAAWHEHQSPPARAHRSAEMCDALRQTPCESAQPLQSHAQPRQAPPPPVAGVQEQGTHWHSSIGAPVHSNA
jgi:hypothetical protein